jgi:predicted permease
MEWRRLLYAAQARLRAIARRTRADDDLGDELSFHLEMQTRENLARGLSAHEAARQARVTLGGVERTKEMTREGRPLHALETFGHDVRYAVRLIRRSPGFALVGVITIALGIGANTAIFSIVNGVLLRPLPYADPDRLVRLYLMNPAQQITDGRLSVPEVSDWNARARTVTSLSGAIAVPMILTGQGDPTEHQVAIVVGDFFGTLGVAARLGRTLTPDDLRSAVPNAVISERLWTSRFDRDPAIVGRTIAMGALRCTIVGVMPASFRYPASDTDFWAPESVLPEEMLGPRVRSQRQFDGIARLSPGATMEQAQAEVNAIAAALASEFPSTNKGWAAARIIPLRTDLVGRVDTALLVVLAVVGTILLIACANLANLLLARGTARRHELATRAALGADRVRIARQLLTESLVLGILGGTIGLALAHWMVRTLLALSAATLPRIDEVYVDGRVIAFGLALAVFASLLFGTLPALRAARTDPHGMRGRGTLGGGGRVRSTLVVAQVALAVLLVIGAGLMARSFLRLRSVDPGFDPDRVLAATIQYNIAGASGDIGAYLVQRRAQILERIASLPGVVAAGSITRMPLEAQCSDTLVFLRADGSGSRDGAPLRAANCLVSPGYLDAMRIPLLRGNKLPEQWPQGAPFPFLVSEAAARRFWPGEDPVGRMVRANYGGRAIVVGVVGDVRQNGLAEDPPPVVYFNQRTAPRSVTTIVVRTTGDPALLAQPIRDAVRQIDPNQPVRRIATLADVMSESMARDRFFTLLFAAFGSLALTLAAVGVYGVLAYTVGQRTTEIGVRIALGAQVRDVLGMVMRSGLQLVGLGVVLGSGAALVVMRVLASQLHGVSARDPLTFVLAPTVLLAVAGLACYLPARRATKIDAITALRAD